MRQLFLFLLIQTSLVLPLKAQVISISEQLIHATTRIECKKMVIDSSGKKSFGFSLGTGFIFNFRGIDSDSIFFPVIVTNKHVVQGAVSAKLQFTLMDEEGNPVYGEKKTIDLINFQNSWIPHPNPSIDLCVIPLTPIIQLLNKKDPPIFYKSLDESLIPNDSIWRSFTAIEDITMIGYPNGLWDSKNNLPIVRTGQTATPLKIAFEGREEFLVNIPVIPGSSGSPIIIYNQGSYSTKNGIVIGTRLYLIGILYAGFTFDAESKGAVKIDKIPIDIITYTKVPTNIGLAIKSNEILILKNELFKLLKNN